MSDREIDAVIRKLVTAAAENHARGEYGMTTLRSTQLPVLAERTHEFGERLGELGVGYDIGALHAGGGIYVSVMSDRRAQAAADHWAAARPAARSAAVRPSAEKEGGE